MENDIIEFDSDKSKQRTENSDCSFYGFWIGIFAAFTSAFSRCFDFRGRTSRFDYWGFLFVYVLCRIAIAFLPLFLEHQIEYDAGHLPLFRLLLSLVTSWIILTVTVRRLHDVNMSGWWVLISIIPFFVSFLKGNKETNRFGPAPATNEKKALYAILATTFPFVLILFVGMFSGYVQATKKFETVKTIDQIQQIVTNTQTLFSSSGKYKALDRPDIMYQVGIYGDDVCRNEQCSRPINPFGGILFMNVAGDGFTLTYGGVPQYACKVLTDTDWSASLPKFEGLSVNSSEFFITLPQEKADTVCKEGSNTMTWKVL